MRYRGPQARVPRARGEREAVESHGLIGVGVRFDVCAVATVSPRVIERGLVQSYGVGRTDKERVSGLESEVQRGQCPVGGAPAAAMKIKRSREKRGLTRAGRSGQEHHVL